MKLLKFLIVCLSILIIGCGGMKVKHVNPDAANALESNERVVFGRVIFITHSEEMGEVSFSPCGLGLFHVETERRASRGTFFVRPWFENDGTFFWILPTGSYHIDALAWGFERQLLRSAPDPKEPRRDQIISVKPDKPPECGFVVNLNMIFNVSGESGALYIGSLLIDMDIKKEYGIEVKNINGIEIRDEYNEALELLKSRYPSCTLTVERRLMTSIPDRPVSVVNGVCPTLANLIAEEFFEECIMHLITAPIGAMGGSGAGSPSIPIGK